MLSLDGANFLIKGDNYPYLMDKFLKINLFKKALEEGVSTSSKIVDEFEDEIAKYLHIDKDNVYATNSGTSALHLSLIISNIEFGSYVNLPVLTYAATANAVKYTGAKIIFSDVDKDTWLMIPNNNFEEDIPLCDCHLPVDLYGNETNFLLYRNIIYDSAESFRNVLIDTNNIYCYSFNGNKIMTTGGGGLIVSSKENIKRIKILASQGKKHNHRINGLYHCIGYNYRMPGLNAALGLSQLELMPFFLKRKREISEIYRNELSNILIFQKIENYSNYWMTAVLFPEEFYIPEIMYYLQSEKIPTKRIFRPLNHSKPFKDGKIYSNAEMIYNRGLCLPSSTLCTDEEIMFVCKMIKRLF